MIPPPASGAISRNLRKTLLRDSALPRNATLVCLAKNYQKLSDTRKGQSIKVVFRVKFSFSSSSCIYTEMTKEHSVVFVDDLLDPVLVGGHPRVDAGEAVPRAADAPRSDADLAALGVAHEQGAAAVALVGETICQSV